MPEMFVVAEFLTFEYEVLLGMLAVRAVVYQPQYFPRLHYFARILNADVFSLADNVQFVRKHAYHMADGSRKNGFSFQAHTPIKTRSGTLLLDVPTGGGGKAISETAIVYGARSDCHRNLRIIAQEYRTAPRFKEVYSSLEHLFEARYENLADLSTATLYWGLSSLFEADAHSLMKRCTEEGFRLTTIERSSQTGIPLSNKSIGRDANDWLVDLCKYYSADEYYFGGTGASCYMDFSRFESAGISLKQQEWLCSPYPQVHGEFVSNLSIIDLLMNVSPEEARDVLRTKER